MADISNNSNPQKDIIDNLLVKEEAGNLHYFQDKVSQTTALPLAKVSTNKASNANSDASKVSDQESTNQQIADIVTAPNDDSFFQDKAPEAKAEAKAGFVFHAEDESQIERLSESVPVDDSKKYSIEKIVEKLLSKQNLKLDDNNKVLFTNLILSFFRNRKSVIATRELLAAKIISEEKTLAAKIVDNILSVIKSLKNKIDSEGGLVVGAEDMEKENSIKVAPIEAKKVEEISLEEVLEEAKPKEDVPEEGEPEANIFLKKIEEQELEDNKIDDDQVDDKEILKTEEAEPEKDAEEALKDVPLGEAIEEKGKEPDNFVSPVKFGVQPKGVNEDEPLAKADIGGDGKAEIDESLAKIKNIIPENKVDDASDSEEDKLLKELSSGMDIKETSDEAKVMPQQDLHDVGQLMAEADNADDEEEVKDKTKEFVIKKVKPADVLAETSAKDMAEDNAKVETKSDEEVTDKTSAQETSELTNLEGVEENLPSNEEDLSTDEQVSNDEEVDKTATMPLPKVIRPGQTFSIKPKISDIQQIESNAVGPKHVLTGPVEELANMTLKNFRFLGTNVEDRKNKILEKINILEQDSYTKKAAGIKAWRQSAVNQLYLSLGSESMTSAKDMTVLIDEKKVAGQETLEMEEFSAISDLNKSLSF